MAYAQSCNDGEWPTSQRARILIVFNDLPLERVCHFATDQCAQINYWGGYSNRKVNRIVTQTSI